MRCEVCGREILGQPQRRIIEGARLTVCSRCASFGQSEWSPGKPTPTKAPPRSQSQGIPPPRPRPRNDVESVEQLQLVEDYGAQIRKARQRLGFSEKDLAKKMQEKESVVKNLEKQELTPDNKLISKIRRYLSIDIVEHTESAGSQITAKPTGAKTIGDMLKMKADMGEETR